ncbi:MAG: anaerobic ribonucleoside-triphosphate reductase, partial [archaeon]
MCCRMRLNVKELRKNITSGLFGSGDATGSVGVVTINLPRLGYTSRNEDEFFEKLSCMISLASESLETKREIVSKNIENGLLPYSKRYLGNLDNHFSTIGIVGMNEALLNLFGYGIMDEEGKKFAVKTLKMMRKEISGIQKRTGHFYNIEATPAESTSYRLAEKDKKKFPKIITAGKRVPYYTNSTMLPVNATDNLILAIENQQDIQKLYTGGTVFHTFLGERVKSADACKELVKKIAFNSTLPYFTITPTYSICPKHGYLSGEHDECPNCKSKCEVYSRVVGYFRPVQNWNIGKQEEYKQRKTFDLKKQKGN